MTVGEMRRFLAQSKLPDDAALFLVVFDDTQRDGLREVEIVQVEDRGGTLDFFLDTPKCDVCGGPVEDCQH